MSRPYSPAAAPLDPEHAPIEPAGAALPALPHARLQPAWLRARFASPPAWQPEMFRDVARDLQAAPLRDAAVLVPVVARASGPQLLLTRRNANLQTHAGQISFPGGSRDATDTDAVHTALREAHEEVGLAESAVEPLGTMPLYTTITGFAVTPVVALVDPSAALRAQPGEVDEVFEVPLGFLMDPAHHQRRSWTMPPAPGSDALGPRTRHFYAMPWEPEPGRRYFIWGATAAMIRNLYRLLIA